MGRHSTYKQELADEICARISAGESLRAICRSIDLHEATARLWIKDNKSFGTQYAQAILDRANAQADNLQEDFEAEPERGPDGKIDPGWVALQRLKIDTKKWIACKMLPKVYGDKIELSGNPDAPLIAPTLNVTVTK